MSSLTSLFSRGLLGARCKTCLNLAISRIKLLHNKREVQLKQMRRRLLKYLQSGQESISRIRVCRELTIFSSFIREENVSAAYEVLELFCEFVLARVDCPSELQEAIASIIYAAPRCSDLPELMQVRNLFTTKYGKEFSAAAAELRPDSNVNRMIIEKLSVRAPPAEVKLRALRGIAQEFGVEWDASSTEIEFSKKHEDLLEGLNSSAIPTASTVIITQSMPPASPQDGLPITPMVQSQPHLPVPAVSNPAPAVVSKISSVGPEKIELPPVDSSLSEGPRGASDALERARAAMALAERASAAARTAAALINAGVHRQAGNGKQSG
ncbi:unnamed protein product [Spirodela intermedia]|uniref:Uncharacterized protein n=1 Tax=Spirodela intermedia TaxID=51605 RepID=A0A7I8J7F1_SPIIN|nr:unnamed protein product [Spirodela intermedia]CAA6665343.1 unnamed protein product [Spirodela intermedia]